ncbi:hypothetical protein [Blastococcus deserti]|uniref:Uncharacterized protein n=1 Tax=Blastococcus deserti TaxID=2259033 RepID=A0ABW4XES2_9ACTN
MHPHLSDLASTAHRTGLRAEGALWAETSRRGGWAGPPRLADRWGAAVRRAAAWAERAHAVRDAGVCCPA